MNSCYILFSATLDRFYIGVSHLQIEQRILKHNTGFYGKNHYTAAASDWEVFLQIGCTDYAHAVRIERHIKKMKSSVYIRNLKKYPEMLHQLVEKYRSI